jgi:hypothetical protein
MCFNFAACMFRNLSVLEVHVGYYKGFYPFFILNNNDTQLSCVFEKKKYLHHIESSYFPICCIQYTPSSLIHDVTTAKLVQFVTGGSMYGWND